MMQKNMPLMFLLPIASVLVAPRELANEMLSGNPWGLGLLVVYVACALFAFHGWCEEGGAQAAARFFASAWLMHWPLVLLLIPLGWAWFEWSDTADPRGERWLITFVLGMCFVPLAIASWVQTGGARATGRALTSIWNWRRKDCDPQMPPARVVRRRR